MESLLAVPTRVVDSWSLVRDVLLFGEAEVLVDLVFEVFDTGDLVIVEEIDHLA